MGIKYENIEAELPALQDILKNSIQNDVLAIEAVDETSDKYHFECQNCPLLKKAQYVVYSPYIKKGYQNYEHYVFLDGTGNTLCHKSGKEFELFGMLKPCINLKPSEIKSFRK